jgi:hypothetical protein
MPARFVIPTPGECERDRDCPEFSSHEEAQSFFESRGGPEQDPHRLDGNDDGEACEDFDFGGDKPRGGVETGFGGMAPRSGTQSGAEPVSLPLAFGGALLVILGAGAPDGHVRGRV